ncbi:MAG TPA: DUF2147 domain-containing protein [Aestuariivirga sp.]|nr:DUF2147 domain-containing protein [Aestuariivirga sp.]
MIRTLTAAAFAALVIATPALADPIAGNWKRPNGIVVRFVPCNAGFCAIVQTGPNKGKSAGKLSASGAGYKGSLTDLENNKTYSGKGSISGSTLKVSGCVLGGLICKSENWTRQ